MDRHLIGRTALGLIAGAWMLGAAGPAGSDSGVTVRLFQFAPGQIEVAAGTRVVWTNQDEITHTVTSGTPEQRDGRFELALAGRGTTGAVTLDTPGTYPYFCSRHQSMRGEIRVK
ncbi:MAG TPA: plastocyanin/azurin family copper-binding protein [Methylomirabilota bacterium]|nr:plastocyanin/azurin family copper-binding protein [Methylomirabilota bacterium]